MTSSVSDYYARINADLLAKIPITSKHVLEIGCGMGMLGRVFKARAPQAYYSAVELFEDAAREAAPYLDGVLVGSIENAKVLNALDSVKKGGRPFDTLVLGDVLEHLQDPWRTLKALREQIAEDGICVTSLPNVAHWSVLLGQMKGRWDYTDAGLLDRTHLRFFTRQTAIEAFEEAGWSVIDATPRVIAPTQTDSVLPHFLSLACIFGIEEKSFIQDLSTYQWVIRAVNGKKPPMMTVAGVGLQKVAGVTEARVDYPLAALGSLPDVQVKYWALDSNLVYWGQELQKLKDLTPGVFVIHRQYLWGSALIQITQHLKQLGWKIVLDIDDDPDHFEAYRQSSPKCFYYTDAVSVSTPVLAEKIRALHPHVEVLPNAILECPSVSGQFPKSGARLNVFFGALNRTEDWKAIASILLKAAEILPIEWTVVHDQAFFEALPTPHKTFYPTQPPAAYLQLLSRCDLALLPLEDTPFNRLKSDLKFIECGAAGVVPICSSVVYGEVPHHFECAYFADTPEAWGEALTQAVNHPEGLKEKRTRIEQYVKAHRMHAHAIEARKAWYQKLKNTD